MLRRSIRYWPDSERPRERLLEKGAETLSDAQLLAIILRTGDQGVSALDLAIQLITRFGGFTGLEQASIPELSELKGIGPAKAAQIKAAIEISRRRERGDGTDNPVFHCSTDVYKYFLPVIGHLGHEEFHVLMLDTKHRLKRDAKISRGTLSSTSVDPREVFNAAVREKSATIVCGHNHPSGDPLPSPEDNALTARLRESGKILGISLLDHVIVGKSGYYSYDEEGWTP